MICREFMPYPFASTTTFDIQPRAQARSLLSFSYNCDPSRTADRGGFLQPKSYGSFPLSPAYSARASAARETDGWPITSIHIPFVENLR